MDIKDKKNHADSKHAKIHGKDLVEINSNLELSGQHKDWYNRCEMGKQRGKPHYAPPKEKKSGKTWEKNK
jgi:hypothetical protein